MDQAQSLREKFGSIINPELEAKLLNTRAISVTSGKGGVGKTSFSINLAARLAEFNYKVLLIDCDFGLANVDIILNLKPQKTLEDIIKGECHINDVIIPTNYNFFLLPASSGIPDIADLDLESQKYLIKQLAIIQSNYDFLIFDTGSGIHRSILRINAACDQVIVVTNPEPTSITDAYSVIKALRTLYKVQTFYLTVMKADKDKALAIKELIEKVSKSNGLMFELKLLGAIANDNVVEKAIYGRKIWRAINSSANAIKDLNKIVDEIMFPSSMPKKKESFWQKWFLFKNVE